MTVRRSGSPGPAPIRKTFPERMAIRKLLLKSRDRNGCAGLADLADLKIGHYTTKKLA